MVSRKIDQTESEETPDQTSEALRKLIEQRDSAFKRFPLIFTLLGTFGLVATFYGFQRIIQDVPFLANNPYITLLTGLAVLLLTGTIYKKLG